MTNYKPVIGLEIHVELKTKCGMFCQCRVGDFGAKPNTHVCPVCLGMPGALPVPNKKAIEWTILIGKALNCQISYSSKFDRKHYFYPDLAKGYQISQYDEPLAIKGKLQIPIYKSQTNTKSQITNNKNKTFRINRVHLEEDTGKLIHLGTETLIDFNRSGTPLVEIVTEPDFDSSDDVKVFLEELHTIIRYLGVSDADMDKGTMRLEPNISVREITNPKSQITNKFQITNFKLPNYKVEVKNINSFKFVKQAIDYEVKRQIEILEAGKTPKQETRGFDSSKQITYSQRSKEEAHDYRYFPEPDIPPMTFTKEYIDSIKVPELPRAKVDRYVKEYNLKYADAFIITRNKKTTDFFEKIIFNFQFTIFNQFPNLKNKFSNIWQLIANFIINKKINSNLTIEQFSNKIVELLQPKEMDVNELNASINRIIEANPKVVADYKSGKQNAIMFLVGQVMRDLKGKCDPKVLKEKLLDELT